MVAVLCRSSLQVFTNHQDEDEDQDESLGAHNEGSQNDCTYMGGGRGYGVLPPAEWCDEPHCVGAGNYRYILRQRYILCRTAVSFSYCMV